VENLDISQIPRSTKTVLGGIGGVTMEVAELVSVNVSGEVLCSPEVTDSALFTITPIANS
jgi:hypothetical protein